MLYIIPFLVALAMLTAGFGIHLLRANRRRVAQRLEEIGSGAADAVHVDPLEPFDRRLPLHLQLVGLFGMLLPTHLNSPTLRWDLAQAGYRAADSTKVFAGARAILTAAFGFAAFFAMTTLHRPQSELLMVTLVSLACGYMAPVAFLRWKQARRREEITLSLPDALDLLVICVEAGLGLNAAILTVGREIRLSSTALSDELRMVNHEMRAGVARVEALRNFAFRTGVDEVRALVAVLVQSDRFGTSIAQALRTHAVSLRTRRRQRAEEAARKTPVKMVFPLVFCIFPELLVVILAPGMLQLFRALLDMSKGG